MHKKDNVYSFNYPLNTQHFYKSPIKETNVAITVQENQAISNYLSNTNLNLSQKNVNANQITVNYSGKTATTKAADDVAFSCQVGEVTTPKACRW
ncbi:MAG: hypothetical protein IPN94_14975 [Sphingobacteriales bacterium]|nr:hypothetical protein [Sphingobacteriales bacterium]